MKTRLTVKAKQIIQDYQSIHIGNITLPCLYYNNRRQGIRAGLRVSIGKGSPKEIEEELQILAQKDRINLQTLDEPMARMFMQKHHIGIDCSALAYYILDAEIHERTNKSLNSILKYPYVTNPFRKLLVKLRSVENTNVKTFAHETNSTEMPLDEVQAGDMITILEGGRDHTWYHVMVVSTVTYTNNTPTELAYTHSYQWSTDGQYNHGVRTGTIELIDLTKPLLEQVWKEQDKQAKENETWQRATEAHQVQLRRLHALNK